jgi:hypothetical protein
VLRSNRQFWVWIGGGTLSNPRRRVTGCDRVCKSFLEVILALHKFRIYIQATKIIIRTDHQALKFLSRCRLLSERLTRWTLLLGQYDYEIELVKGKDNVVADILSRYPSDGEASYEYPREQPIVAMFEVHNTPEMLQLMSDLQQHQTDDPAELLQIRGLNGFGHNII